MAPATAYLRWAISHWGDLQDFAELVQADIEKYRGLYTKLAVDFPKTFSAALDDKPDFSAAATDQDLVDLAAANGVTVPEIVKWLEAHPIIYAIFKIAPFLILM